MVPRSAAHLILERPGFFGRSVQQIAIDLEERVVDRVLQPRPLGAGQLVVVAPENGVLQMLDRAGELASEVIAGASSW